MLNIEEFAKSNRLFDNHYKLIRPLSTDGGTADVWLAVDVNTLESSENITPENVDENSMVAIKIYRPKNALDINGEKIFRDEYKIVHRCNHANILPPSHFDIFEEIPYLEIRYCRNGSSENLIGKSLSEQDLWKFIEEVAEGLAYLHDTVSPPIIHQDIKPGNILIDDYGNYTITDFGISAAIGKTSNDYSFDDEYSGTMAYMAPERFSENYIPRKESDIWALGVTLYEILVNNVPFGDYGGDQQMREDRYEPLPKSIPSDIRKLIDRCLCINPEKRPTARDIAQIAKVHQKANKHPKYKWMNLAIISLFIACGAILLFPGKRKESTTESGTIQKPEPTPLPVPKPIPSPMPEPRPDPTLEQKQSTKPNPTPVPDPKPIPKPLPEPNPVPSTGTINLGYATYTGPISDGKPNGEGTMRFNKAHKLPGTDSDAQAGYVFKGRFIQGKISYGKLYDENGNVVETI